MTEDTNTKCYIKLQTKEYKKDQRKRLRHNWLFMNWLLVDYPRLFNAENSIPFNKSVRKELKMYLPKSVSKVDLKYVLSWYSHRINYLQALREQTHGVNL
jgi:hypothetical protein